MDTHNIVLFSIPLYLLTGQYRSITRYFSSQVVYFIALRNLILVFAVILTGFIINFKRKPAAGCNLVTNYNLRLNNKTFN